jgi:dolichol kinase
MLGLVDDWLMIVLCYFYVVSMILLSSRMSGLRISQKVSRKFLHAMIGNLVFFIPFFKWVFSPFIAAAPFIVVTFLASPLSPWVFLRERMRGLSELTEEGHHTGLFLYSISFSLLALLYAPVPHIIAFGVLPMAYGDSSAALVGQRMGKRKYRLITEKSVEGSFAMFIVSLLSLVISGLYFSNFYLFSVGEKLLFFLVVSLVVTVVEAISPRGFDNIGVPLIGALTFLIMDRWF